MTYKSDSRKKIRKTVAGRSAGRQIERRRPSNATEAPSPPLSNLGDTLVMEAAMGLAKDLDAENYQAAEIRLAVGCIYKFRGRTIKGPRAIMGSYRSNGEKARRQFDEVVYQSSVVPLSANEARIEYIDRLTIAGDTHVHRCYQRVCIDGDGLVCGITHVDLDGQREALQQFLDRHA